MKYSLLKFKSLSRSFSNKINVNKFNSIPSTVNVKAPIKPDDFVIQDTECQIKTPPKPGEYFMLPTINSKWLALEYGYTKAFDREPVSAFYSIKYKDKLYHVFNAARIPLGRMCSKIAFIIQGKTSPLYRPNVIEYKDQIIIVNGKYAYLSGQKLEQKLYRHHTGYPGGLKEIKARHFLEKDAEGMILRTIKGMLPKNLLREKYLAKVKIYNEGGHDLQKIGFPQFGKIKPVDYNEIIGKNFENDEIIYSPYNENNMPPELKKLKFNKELNEELSKPEYLKQQKTVTNLKMDVAYINYTRRLRYRQYRRIRSKGYRYI